MKKSCHMNLILCIIHIIEFLFACIISSFGVQWHNIILHIILSQSSLNGFQTKNSYSVQTQEKERIQAKGERWHAKKERMHAKEEENVIRPCLRLNLAESPHLQPFVNVELWYKPCNTILYISAKNKQCKLIYQRITGKMTNQQVGF